MKDGIIWLDSVRSKKFGFTSRKFIGGSYLWKRGNFIYISFIESRKKRKGYFNKLLKDIKKNGYQIKVPSPVGLMQLILLKKGYRPTIENRECEVWSNDN